MAVIEHIGNQVWERLENPKCIITFTEFAQRWQCLDISIIISGHGCLASAPDLLHMLRGAIGRRLMQGASLESLTQKICPWVPPCANDVFFGPKPEIKITRHTQTIPKPFVLSVKSQKQDLIITISLFGFASEWQADIRTALVGAIRKNIDWQRLAKNTFIPNDLKYQVYTKEISINKSMHVPNSIILDFITPVDCKNTDPAENPASVLHRLASRLYLLARWYELGVDVDWKTLSNAWRALVINIESEKPHTLVRNSKRARTQYKISGRRLSLTLEGDLSLLWPLLLMGEQAHIGRGTSAGLGRYKLKSTEKLI